MPDNALCFDVASYASQASQAETIYTHEEEPGLTDHPGSFIKCDTNERKLSGYLGFSNTSELRALSASWPILRALVAVNPMVHGIPTHQALGLLQDVSDFVTVSDPNAKWPLLGSDSKADTSLKRAKHFATVVINLRSDLIQMASNTTQQNQALHVQYSPAFQATFSDPQDVSAYVSYPIKAPLLQPLEGEGPLEPFNRCMMLLRFVRDTVRAKRFGAKFSSEGIKKGVVVAKEHKPKWMRLQVASLADDILGESYQSSFEEDVPPGSAENDEPRIRESKLVGKDKSIEETVTTTATFSAPAHTAISPGSDKRSLEPESVPSSNSFSDITTQDTQPQGACAPERQRSPKSFPAEVFHIIWDHKIEPEHAKPVLRAALDRARGQGISMPSELQKLQMDPRLLDDESLLYEQIRSQFDCEALRIEIDKLYLQFTTTAFGGSITIVQNMDRDLWPDTQAVLRDPNNSGFVFYVGFFAVDV